VAVAIAVVAIALVAIALVAIETFAPAIVVPAAAQPAAGGSSAAPATAANGAGIRTLYLVRHGDYDSEDKRDDMIGKALVPLGREQAQLVAQRLAALPLRFDALYASPMTRARQTAEIVHAALPALAAQSAPEIAECTPPTRRMDIMRDLAPGEAETCQERLDAAYAHFVQPAGDADRNEILVCHGNVIRYFVCRALGVDPTAWLGMTIANCSLTVLQVKPDGSARLVSFDDVGHIPVDKQTYTGRKPAPPVVK
jgi:serine/threonine-protein phosphatase PGAM5